MCEDFPISINNFDIIRHISTGSFANIYLIKEKSTGKEYIAKQLLNDKEEDEEEKQMLHEICELKHPTIIRFLGVSYETINGNKSSIIFMEFAKNGSLYDLLLSKSKPYQYFDNTARQIILAGVARGINILHNHQIIHMDIKPANILIDSLFHPKISGFSLAEKFGHVTKYGGTLIFEAPEVINMERDLDEKVDIYSFGILMFQVVTGIDVFEEIRVKKIPIFKYKAEYVLNGGRPEFSVPVKDSIKKLIEKCWSGDADERPTSEELYKKLAFDENYYLDDVDVDVLKKYINEINEE